MSSSSKVNIFFLLIVFSIVINSNCLFFVTIMENFDVGDDGLSYDFDTFVLGTIDVQADDTPSTAEPKKKNKKRKAEGPSGSLPEPSIPSSYMLASNPSVASPESAVHGFPALHPQDITMEVLYDEFASMVIA